MYASFDYVRRIVPETSTAFITVPVLFPLAGASVDLWFTNSLYYASGTVAVTDELSCSRASIGYAKTSAGTLTQFGTNTLRITNLGLLIEDTRTNLAKYSQDMTKFPGNWESPSNLTVTNSISAPDGTSTACQYTESSDGSPTVHDQSQLFSSVLPAGNAYSASVYAKTNSRNLYLFLSDNETGAIDAIFDLSNGTASTQIGTIGSWTSRATSVETLANGYYRCILSGTKGGTGSNGTLGLRLADGTNTSYTGNGSSGIYVWGAQVEQGAFGSSYVPTTTTSAARAADNITIIGGANTAINNTTGSIVAQINNGSGSSFAANIVDSNGTNLLGFDATNHGLASISATLATANTANRTSRDKVGIAWSAAGRSLVLNNGTVATDATAQSPSATQNLGSASGTSNFIYAYSERLTVWTSKLSDTTLKGFTV